MERLIPGHDGAPMPLEALKATKFGQTDSRTEMMRDRAVGLGNEVVDSFTVIGDANTKMPFFCGTARSSFGEE